MAEVKGERRRSLQEKADGDGGVASGRKGKKGDRERDWPRHNFDQEVACSDEPVVVWALLKEEKEDAAKVAFEGKGLTKW